MQKTLRRGSAVGASVQLGLTATMAWGQAGKGEAGAAAHRGRPAGLGHQLYLAAES